MIYNTLHQLYEKITNYNTYSNKAYFCLYFVINLILYNELIAVFLLHRKRKNDIADFTL
ncbi:hypothetical protein Xmau_01724 [Xenorhabdus mauleonii]|uniref:Uncharacterized protein n=1 Tax=Xenorhabdus mauleonii TaxID=351675 RepID=A0A1I3L6H6_9GAMM|nr:hypothetical protein Xmau_01724 [Xenorhabdus mauleonii]SFI80297.1 hypothetical protein SAMN05421680_103310 [Xenorhabdus mauleonii]